MFWPRTLESVNPFILSNSITSHLLFILPGNLHLPLFSFTGVFLSSLWSHVFWITTRKVEILISLVTAVSGHLPATAFEILILGLTFSAFVHQPMFWARLA
jgi:hypothetical protein